MSTVRDLHKEAMRLAHLAVVARHDDDLVRAEALARQAFEYERQAADLIPEARESEPTRSILYRSAASLAYQCKDLSTSLRLIAKGLSGYPTPQVEDELRSLYEQVKFEQSLQARGLNLAEDELQISMNGSGVGYGTVLYDLFMKRIRSANSLIDRTVQRLLGASYQRSGRVPNSLRPFTSVLSAAPPGSFAMNIKLTVSRKHQPSLLVSAHDVIENLLTGLDMVNDDRDDDLRAFVQSEAYYRNFVSLTRDMAPDNEGISAVGFSGHGKSVNLTRHHEQIALPPPSPIASSLNTPALIRVRIEGVLDYASARRGHAEFGLTTDDSQEFAIVVAEGLDDVVRAYFKQRVIVTGVREGERVHLTDVQPRVEYESLTLGLE
jgi:hypothetical protein